MMAEIEIRSERVDDLPLLIKQQQKLGIAEIIDGIIKPHWHRQGLSVGQTIEAWMSYILSSSDHRLSYVEPWVANHLETLRRLINPALRVPDFSDDRLGDVLRYLSDDEDWTTIEQEVGQRSVRVYELPQERVRLDSTSVSLYHDPEGTELIHHGYSKDHRPDLAQLKVMLSTLDPLGMPLATQVVSGNTADDGLYIPAVDEVREVLGQKGVLYVGDSKMEALSTRAHLEAGDDYYLTPLSTKGAPAEWLAELVEVALTETTDLVDVYRQGVDDQPPKLIAQGYETSRPQEALVDDELIEWTERILVIYSPSMAQRAYQGLQGRLQRAEEKLLALTPTPGRGKRQYDQLAALQADAKAILQQYRVTGLLPVTYERQVSQRHIRKYKDRPARTEEKVRYQLHLSHDEAAIQARYRTLGWRLYALNAPAEQLSLTDAVFAYRGAPNIERNFSRLKGRPLGLRPVYLQREDHLTGLVRLLSLALRILSLTEFVVRQALDDADQSLAGLYPGNPNQQTQSPTAERLLAAFQEITLSFVHLPDQVIIHISPLTPLQSRILSLLGFSTSIYSDLVAHLLPIPP